MSCEHPIRVYNKYIDKYLFVPCGKCNTCKNRRAKYWTDACERERRNSLYTLFVTLTYDEYSLPYYNVTGGFDDLSSDFSKVKYLQSTRLHDKECMAISKELFDEDCDRDLFYFNLKNRGIPYASKSDIQLFHKRLNKFLHDNVTNKYQNFRYFIVSEYGSTTLRPHFHAIYFVNDKEVAREFHRCLLSCWKFGRLDCQFVEGTASSYVAQYINKLSDLPSFYKASQIRPFFLFSRNPVIGNGYEHTQSDEEIFNSGTVQKFDYSRRLSKFVLSELDKSTENRLYPKCPYFSQVSDFVRIELYSVVCRFGSKEFGAFKRKVGEYLDKGVGNSEFGFYLRNSVDGFSESGVNWLRRLFYLSRKVMKLTLRLGISISSYVKKVDVYYKNKELHLINKMYKFQEEYMQNSSDNPCVDDLSLMYPDYLHSVGVSIGEFLSQFTPRNVIEQRFSAALIQNNNKRSHFKNMYLDSLKEKNNKYFVSLKNYFYAKKRYEIVEAFAS